VPPSWSSALDNYPGILQWCDPSCEINYTVAGGTLMRKTEDEAYNLIEEMTLNNFQWSSEQA